jgi:hypothetical protein
MDTDKINQLEEEAKLCKSIAVASQFLFMQTREQGFSRDCCFLWATYVLMPMLRPWARQVANKLMLQDNTRLT